MKRLYLLGQPIAHSLSPALHNAALAALGLAWRYELLELSPDELPGAMARLRSDDCAGANVTIPHKETIVALLDGLGESAREIGAVNTVVKQGGRLLGENTDAPGFLRALAAEAIDPRGARVALIGAGGAARAVGFALGAAGPRSLAILNRTPERARSLADDLARRFPEIAVGLEQSEEADLLVSAIPPSAEFDWVGPRLAPGAVAYDLTYRAATTPFLSWAAAAGARTANGLGMLVHQAAASLAMWTGREAPVDLMFGAARRALKEDL